MFTKLRTNTAHHLVCSLNTSPKQLHVGRETHQTFIAACISIHCVKVLHRIFPFRASINFGADNPVYIFINAKATLPSGVKKDSLPRFTHRLLGFDSIRPNDIAISRREGSDLMRPSSDVLKVSTYR